ncbi:CBASS cGAMP-activated phospholipase [Bacillus suaedaesalsae]|uniref:Patatin-like phospholipase family protein n=1 Tax=Bacillus suaedaesalsae TaxID=2810349 RepID=A0ABS2DM28_9BACI|nr:CBASS cGAMP-activated phospholipase [Bacillus suaedaesalsae]MBM6619538.1 patatin-like phospholipase family protein [Bacillus suaedaesalsae]
MKMLCIDGGGIRGVFAISILKEIEKEVGKPINQLFNCISGTSTGSIIAASIALEVEMGKVLDSYQKYGKKIFVQQAKVGLFRSVYSSQFLRKYLQQEFQEVSLKDIKHPLLIPAVDLSHGKPFVYRSNYGNLEEQDDNVLLWDAVLSSCSAPIYFEPNNIDNEYLSIDGGLWANNPSLVCMTEAIHHFQTPMSEIKILSIGTGQQKIDFSIEKKLDWGINKWLPFTLPSMKVTPKLLDLALHLSSESVSYHCKLLLKDHYLRINEELGEEIPFDELESVEYLIDLAKECYISHKDEILQFLS